MRKPIKVLIQGTGFAGQGHAEAFRYAGAEVVGIVGRTESVVKEVAAQLAIPYAGTHWEEALQTLKPDIVSIATPGGAHEIPIIQAIQHGCHVFSDKPLSTTGESAQRLYELAEQKQVKTAFAASFRYMPDVIHAKRLIEAGEIGEPQEVECISHFNLEKHIPYGWSHRKEDGGGRLNNNFTHKLSIVTSMIGEHLLSMMGEVRDDLGKAPIVEGVHNFKKRRDFIPQDINDPDLTWGESNVEWSYTVLAQIQSELAKKPVSVLFKHGGLHPRFNDDHIVVYGSKGAIYIKGHYASGPLYLYRDGNWEAQPLPQDIIERIPEGESDTERNWRYLIRLLVEDVQGNGVQPYQTFKEGAQYQKLIDLIRQNDNWVDVSQL
ncbi:MAG TPA: gfo/Idh/MocA family oxidoreductase [Alteromonas australica]|mgnify:FL=1|jgi:predicted dehydrogenase|uniref:Gfo/Idh/MocA family oxidoreductase n=1 Tax=Alteromonas australica TaxID=589873 RepID=A0A350P796_9ALTE|nr:Gfo/Idh/MocA family oxidoreductase [Alteromonas australica]MAF70509.1 oxidoreductase [Alteromonas sp.]MAO31448.1 oxidoreductase [Alteromonas sp.]MBU33914.1 oxidoreductase [Alteromonas sp.]HAI73109.1 gfo/Idh/MocA family oxidoreductase [Alteromonas australica]HAW77163.1 gfo/Idh/MocA family oxidoreductase [Alteromonas australica]|tara:strand:- start:8581 stop:9714 length:1134 start_codon:yes stop_codon:yes gene_type:complete